MSGLQDYLKEFIYVPSITRLIISKFYSYLLSDNPHIGEGWIELNHISENPPLPASEKVQPNDDETHYAVDAFDAAVGCRDYDIRCLVSEVKKALATEQIAKHARRQFLLDYKRTTNVNIDGKNNFNERTSDAKRAVAMCLWAQAVAEKTAGITNISVTKVMNSISVLCQSVGNQTLHILCNHLDSFTLGNHQVISLLPLQRSTNYQDKFFKDGNKFSKKFCLPIQVLTADTDPEQGWQNPDLEVTVMLTIDFATQQNSPERIRYDLIIKKLNPDLNFDLSALDKFKIANRFEIVAAEDNEWSLVRKETSRLTFGA